MGKRFIRPGITKNYSQTTVETLRFSWKADATFAVSMGMSLNLDGALFASELNENLSVSMIHSAAYISSTSYDLEITKNLKLTRAQAQSNCSRSYDMSIGRYGLYYLIECSRVEKESWWWGDSDVTSLIDRNKNFNLIDVNESQLTVGYIYKRA